MTESDGKSVQMGRKFSSQIYFFSTPIFSINIFCFTFPLQEKENFPLKTLLDMELVCADVGGCLTQVIWILHAI